MIKKNRIFSKKVVHEQVAAHGTPIYLYSKNHLRSRVAQCTQKGVTVRYAVKANAHNDVVTLFNQLGLHFDASSSYEADYLRRSGISGSKIRLSSQEPAHNLKELLEAEIRFTATSLHQLYHFAQVASRHHTLGVRINPGFGSGADTRRNTGGKNSSFGIWHTYIPDVLNFCAQKGLTITTLHIHVGSGADPKIWAKVIDRSLHILSQFPTVTTLDIGGGYKIHRYGKEEEADMKKIISIFKKKIRSFEKTMQRSISLEIEPGTWLVGHAGILVARVVDIVDTGKGGYTFVKLNTGMNDILRPTLYGAEHEIEVLSAEKKKGRYVFVGHNCETGDILSPKKGKPSEISERVVVRPKIGDYVIIHDTGAYCASMRAHGYNAFPGANEFCI